MPDPQPSRRSGAGYAALAGSAVLLATTVLTAPNEGFAPKPYWDPAHIRSYCFGETEHVQERLYSRGECALLLQQRMMRDYAPPIERCLPELAADPNRVKILAAFLDAAYNAGTVAVCSSPMAARIHVGDIAGSIAAFTAKGSIGPLVTHGWFTTARYRGPKQPAAVMRAHGWTWAANAWRKELPGLVCRRIKESRLAAGLPPPKAC